MKNNRSMRREGFTLVELLIVIVVIGVLSAMMMLSSTEAVSSARASNIVSNLRNLKTAALAFYTDNLDAVDNSGNIAGTTTTFSNLDAARTHVLKYLSNNSDTGDIANYKFLGTSAANSWYVYITVKDSNVYNKLYSRRTSTGLRKVSNSSNVGSGADLPSSMENNGTQVGIFIR